MPTYYKNIKGFEIDVPDLAGDGSRLPYGNYFVQGTFYSYLTAGVNKCLAEVVDGPTLAYIAANPSSVIYSYPTVVGQLVTVPKPSNPSSSGENGQIAIDGTDIYIRMSGSWYKATGLANTGWPE